MIKYLQNIGPGVLVTAAFIGPGTITVCILAGNTYAFSLLWALLFATFATIVLQEMSARLGLVTKAGLSDALRTQIKNPLFRYGSFALVGMGILLGNAAYEAGNIAGTLIGMKMVAGDLLPDPYYKTIIYLLAMVLLFFGTYKVLEKFFITIVLLMSLSFFAGAIITQPNVWHLLKGMLIPTFPDGGISTIVGLIGTTVVPYNLFLHSAMIHRKWSDVTQLSLAKKDTIMAVAVGGLISACILITGAFTYGQTIKDIGSLSGSFEEIYGDIGRYLFGFGMFSAGFTSTITAPLAGSLVVKGLFNWDEDEDKNKIRSVWMLILSVGYIFTSIGYKPIEIIKVAQFANGLLLPLIATFLIHLVNDKGMMGSFRNTQRQNVIGYLVLLISIAIGLRGVLSVL